MKTTQFLSIALASVVLLAGCAKEDETTNLPENGKKIHTLEAATPDDSRTALDGVKVYWAEGDALGVAEYRASGEKMPAPITYNIATGAGSQIATFTSPTGITTDKFLAVYPASGCHNSGTFLKLLLPATQTYVANGIANNVLPMYAFSEDPMHLSFNYAASVLRVPVYADAAGEKVDRVTVSVSGIDKANGSYPLAGELYFATANWGKFYGFSSTVETTSIEYNMNDTELSTDPENPTVLNIVVGASGVNKTYNILKDLTFFFELTDGRSFTKTKGSPLTVGLGTVVNFPKLKCLFNQISDIVVKVDGGEETIWLDYIESPTVATNSIVVTTKNDVSLTENMLSFLKQQVDACANAVVLDMKGAKYISAVFPDIFKNSTKLAEIYLPYNITNLVKQAFYMCSYLTDAHLHEGLLTINDNAFGYTAINPLYIPASVNKIGYFILNGGGAAVAGN
ncbi:MAG: leucine-rich repeat protein, partial [Alistipes sp.]